jgi:competence protein ComEC
VKPGEALRGLLLSSRAQAMLRPVVALTLLLPASVSGQPLLRIHHLDVGQGSATLLVGPAGRSCLVDAGEPGQGTAVVVPFLLQQGITRLDAVVLTHYHSDHWGGIPEVLGAGFGPTVVYDRGTAAIPGGLGGYLNSIAASGSTRTTLLPGMVIDLGCGARVECIGANGSSVFGGWVPVAGQYQEENARSVALRLVYGNFQQALCGDLTGGGGGTPDVESLLAPAMGDVDVMVMNHHGSSTSSNATWVATLDPEIVVCSCGAQNPYGHPHAQATGTVLANPATIGLFVLNAGTAGQAGILVDGHFTVTTDGASYTYGGGLVAQASRAVDEGPGLRGVLPGDVVIAEYMHDPAAVPDSVGEWIELANTRAESIELRGFVLRDHGTDSVTLPGLTIPPRGRIVLARNGNPAQNGGVIAHWVWPGGSSCGFCLGNGADEIELRRPDGLVIDLVVYDGGATFPDPVGRSVERKDLSALPVAANFGVAQALIAGPGPGSDYGTPGLPNSIDQTPPWVGLLPLAGPVLGTTVPLEVSGTAALAGSPYLLGFADCPHPGVLLSLTHRVVPLCPGPLLLLSITPGNGFVQGFAGSLDASGRGLAALIVPAEPLLCGFVLDLSGIVLGAGPPDGVVAVIDHLALRLH